MSGASKTVYAYVNVRIRPPGVFIYTADTRRVSYPIRPADPPVSRARSPNVAEDKRDTE